MTREEELIKWCDKQIEYHSKSDKIFHKIRVDGAKQIKIMIETKGWDKLYEFVKERISWKDSQMTGPYYLGLFYQDVKNKMWKYNN